MRVGRLLDHPVAARGVDYGRRAIELVFADANAAGGIRGEALEVVDCDAVGSMDRVAAGARRLAADGCVLILGPAVTDFAVPLVPVLDELQVPAVNWAGSALARGAWMFQLKVGSLPDEAGHLTRLLAGRGYRRIVVARDRGPIGDEYVAFLRRGLETTGVAIVADVELAAGVDVGAAARAWRALDPECVVYLGFGTIGVALCRTLRDFAWTVPVVGNIGIGVSPSPELNGVVFTDVVDETNPVLRRFADRYQVRHGTPPTLLGLAAAHDLAATAVEALRLAPAPTPAGVRAGLERICGLPAAAGAPGTTIGFGPWDRDGYKGALIVFREIRDSRAVAHRL
jgi:ABC-type branched-subunit amino acid transport system substrate-binding protein